MPRLLFEFLDALDGDPLRRGLPGDFGRRLLRDQPDLRLRAGEGRLDVQEALQPGLLFEDRLHLRPPVAEDDREQEGHDHPARAKPGGVMELSPAAASLRWSRDFRQDYREGRAPRAKGGPRVAI